MQLHEIIITCQIEPLPGSFHFPTLLDCYYQHKICHHSCFKKYFLWVHNHHHLSNFSVAIYLKIPWEWHLDSLILLFSLQFIPIPIISPWFLLSRLPVISFLPNLIANSHLGLLAQRLHWACRNIYLKHYSLCSSLSINKLASLFSSLMREWQTITWTSLGHSHYTSPPQIRWGLLCVCTGLGD